MKISTSSAWDQAGIARFLEGTTIPIRIAVQDGDFPLICSVWFRYDAARERILCVSHKASYLVKLLEQVGRCAFEIAPNEPPYRGVRGKAEVSLHANSAESLLHELIERYLDDTDSSLAKWLLGRAEDELVIELEPQWITAWDYSERM